MRLSFTPVPLFFPLAVWRALGSIGPDASARRARWEGFNGVGRLCRDTTEHVFAFTLEEGPIGPHPVKPPETAAF